MSTWAEEIRADRSLFGAHLRAAQHVGADGDLLHRALAQTGACVDRVAARGAPDAAIATLTRVLFARVCGLVAQGAWERAGLRWIAESVLPALAPVLPASADGVVAVLTDLENAAHHVEDLDRARWAARLSRAVLEAGSVATLRELAVIAAWRTGGVRWRAASLDAAERVSERALAAALDLNPVAAAEHGGASAVLDRNRLEPWWWPGGGAGPWHVGGFRGFGGAWIRVPTLLGGDGVRWVVRTEQAAGDGGASPTQEPHLRWWVVTADRHGAHVRPTVAADDIGGTWCTPDGSPGPRGAVRAWTTPTSYRLWLAPT